MDLIELVGLFAGFCTTFAFVPQLLHAWKTKRTRDLSWAMLAVFFLGVIFWVIYGAFLLSVPIVFWNVILGLLLLALIGLKARFDGFASKR